MDPDVLIIGGGPAGLAAAIAAAQAGFSVAVAEPGSGTLNKPLDKCCGEGLLPLAVDCLARLGVPLAALQHHGFPLTGICFQAAGARAEARFRAPAIGIRRTALHRLLFERAQQAGVVLIPSAIRVVPGVSGPQAQLASGPRMAQSQPARWLVGADGASGSTRAAAGFRPGRAASRRFAIRQHFQMEPNRPTPTLVEVHWARSAQAYITPVGAGRVGVAVLSSAKLSGMEAALAPFPAVRRLLENSVACSGPRGAVTSHLTLPAVCRGRIALAGDAAGCVDAITGDGLSLAFAQALALGSALRAGDLAQYARAHRRLMRVPRLMSRLLLTMGKHPALTRASLGLLAHTPGLFPALLNLHTRAPSEPASPWPPIPTAAELGT